MDPVYLLKAKVDGHTVRESMEARLKEADVVITATGCFHIITTQHIHCFRPGVILRNAGHFGFEIDAAARQTR